ncbi:MAG: sulfatase, partial [Planctomycetota bacterium]|nr:sulfatase [Planctomycetota bacterium]
MRISIPLLCLGIAYSFSCSQQESPKLNVVLISLDSLCKERLGAYGHRPQYAPEIPVSPNIDDFAAEALLFDNAWSTTSWTLPAHMSLMSGLSDRNHEVELDYFALDPKRRTISQNFQDAGYQTAGFFSGPYLDGKFGFARGFDIWRSAMMTPSELAGQIRSWTKRRALAGKPAPTEEEIKGIRDRVSHWDVTSPKVNQGALDFLASRDSEVPFFLTLHYFDAHYDYLPDTLEKGLGARFDPDYRGNFEGANWYFNPAVREQTPPYGQKISERDLGHILALYDAEIHWVDRHIGTILQALKDQGLWETTIVCIVADHG